MATSVGQVFEVYASKTEADAKALASSKPGAMCFTTDTHRIVFNGVVYNLVEIINNLTDGSTNKALSAAQGKALKGLIDALPTVDEMNTAINGKLGSVYRVMGTKANISEVLALTNAVKGDTWNVTAEFTLGGKKYPAGTNVVCVTNTSSSDHNDDNWDALGGTVDLSVFLKAADAASTYLKKTDASNTYLSKTEAGNTYLKKTDASSTYATKADVAKKANVYKFKGDLSTITEDTNASQLTSILGNASEVISAYQSGFVFQGNIGDEIIAPVSVGFVSDSYIILEFVGTFGKLNHIDITLDEGDVYLDVNEIRNIDPLTNSDVVDNLTSTSKDKPLSAAQGKKLQDEKLSKTDASNTYATKGALSTVQSTANTAKTNADKAVAALTIK
jgi:hypothetical protein